MQAGVGMGLPVLPFLLAAYPRPCDMFLRTVYCMACLVLWAVPQEGKDHSCPLQEFHLHEAGGTQVRGTGAVAERVRARLLCTVEVIVRTSPRGWEDLRDCLARRKRWVLAVQLCTEKEAGLKEIEILSLMDSVPVPLV